MLKVQASNDNNEKLDNDMSNNDEENNDKFDQIESGYNINKKKEFNYLENNDFDDDNNDNNKSQEYNANYNNESKADDNYIIVENNNKNDKISNYDDNIPNNNENNDEDKNSEIKMKTLQEIIQENIDNTPKKIVDIFNSKTSLEDKSNIYDKLNSKFILKVPKNLISNKNNLKKTNNYIYMGNNY